MSQGYTSRNSAVKDPWAVIHSGSHEDTQAPENWSSMAPETIIPSVRPAPGKSLQDPVDNDLLGPHAAAA